VAEQQIEHDLGRTWRRLPTTEWATGSTTVGQGIGNRTGRSGKFFEWQVGRWGLIYDAVMTTPGEWAFKPDDITTRAELAKFGGNQQAGIAHSTRTPNVMIFSDADATESPGYAFDGWVGDIYQYTGEGKRGDQKMSIGNKALRDHARTNRSLRVFVADGKVPKRNTKLQRYVGEFALDIEEPYFQREARDVDGKSRKVFVFRLRPVGDVVRKAQNANAFSGSNEVVPVGVHAIPTEASDKMNYEYQQGGTKKARRWEAELSDRFEEYFRNVHQHSVIRYRLATAGSAGSQFTDIVDATAKILYEAKGVANRMSVRLALGQILDYGRYVKDTHPGTELAILLPQHPPADMIELLKSLNIGCIVEQSGAFIDETGLQRCP